MVGSLLGYAEGRAAFPVYLPGSSRRGGKRGGGAGQEGGKRSRRREGCPPPPPALKAADLDLSSFDMNRHPNSSDSSTAQGSEGSPVSHMPGSNQRLRMLSGSLAARVANGGDEEAGEEGAGVWVGESDMVLLLSRFMSTAARGGEGSRGGGFTSLHRRVYKAEGFKAAFLGGHLIAIRTTR